MAKMSNRISVLLLQAKRQGGVPPDGVTSISHSDRIISITLTGSPPTLTPCLGSCQPSVETDSNSPFFQSVRNLLGHVSLALQITKENTNVG